MLMPVSAAMTPLSKADEDFGSVRVVMIGHSNGNYFILPKGRAGLPVSRRMGIRVAALAPRRGSANHRTAPPIGKYHCLRSVSCSSADDNAPLCDVNDARTTQTFVAGYVSGFIQVASSPRLPRGLKFLVRVNEFGVYTIRPNLKFQTLRESRLGDPRTARKDGQAGHT